ncbi:MAG: bacterial Ig-like domain-containing protein [bacterium]|nr:bacterial Ig-like domain-containing protein [bacterium]
MKRLISIAAAAAMTVSLVPIYSAGAAVSGEMASVNYKYGENTYIRQMEKLDRGLIAVNTGNGIYIGWRLLGDECSVSDIKRAPSFDVYRNGEKIAAVTDSTNYLDTAGNASDSYSVAVKDTDELCEAVSVNSGSYFDVHLDRPAAFAVDSETSYEYTIGDCSTGDLDGDGQYELVVKWDSNPQDNSNGGITGNVLLDAYELDGTKLWRIDLGRNIRAGAHYTQFLVYDFDMDGKSEVTCKTAPGSLDGKGNYVSEASSVDAIKGTDNSAVYVNSGGYILDGDEFFTAFDGETGAAIDTIYYPVQRISAVIWGDDFGNRVDRFLADVAYLDGERPYAVYWRGYYHGQSGKGQRTGICAMSLDENGKLSCDYCFDTYDTSTTKGYKGVNGYTDGNENYVGQGNHNLTVADVDNDGKDEVISGAMCMEVKNDNNLIPKWCTFKGHGDALHIGDYDPTHDGLEFYTVHEEGGGTESVIGQTLDFGQSVIDANTGEIIWHVSCSKDTGRGMMANVGAGGYYQVNASSGAGSYIANGGNSFTAANLGLSVNFRIFWDADIYEELLDGTNITSWNGSRMETIFSADGCVSVNGTKANPALQADLFGDWREEVCYPLSDNSALRVFTTTDVTTYKLPTLMHDPVYRSGVAAEQTAYNQPPHIGFYFADEIYRTALVGIDVGAPEKTEYNVGESLDLTGLMVTGSYDDGSNYDIDGYSVTGYDSMRAGEQAVTVSYRGFEKTFMVNVNTDFTVNESGLITGYTGTAARAIIPESVNDAEITGIAENALDGTAVKELYVHDNIEKIERNSFDGIKVYCYEGSDMHIYALENGIDFELMERAANEYIINTSFDESEYDNFGFYQESSTKIVDKGRITYGVGGRTKGGGDGYSGFDVDEADGNRYLRAVLGRFGTNGRQPYMTFADSPRLSDSYDNVMSFRFMIPYIKHDGASERTECYMNLNDSAGTIDTVSKDNLGIDYDTWYCYSLIYHKGSYYRALSDADGNLISLTNLGGTAADTGISGAALNQVRGTAYNNNLYYSYIAIDDLQIYSTDSAISEIYVNVRDKNGVPIERASVKLGGFTVETDEDGIAEFLVPAGIYHSEITADGYEGTEPVVAAYKNEVIKKVLLEVINVEANGVSVDKTEASAAVGGTFRLNAATEPENATERDFVWSSSNEAVAKVDAEGNVTTLSVGTAEIKVMLKGYEAVCTVTVYDTSAYEQIPNAVIIELSSDKAEIPLSGINQTVLCDAVVYDQNNIPIDNAYVSWSCDKAEIRNGRLYITPDTEEGTARINAVCGEISASKDIELVSMLADADIFVNTTYSEAADVQVRQLPEAMIETRGDLTYYGGSRDGSVKAEIGVWAVEDENGNIYMKGGSSNWSSANRNSYINIDKAPSAYEAGKQYVFETDIMFDKTSPNAVTLSNGIVLSVTALGAESGKWYHYALVYDGQYTQYLFDENGRLVSKKLLTNTSTEPISRLNFGVSGEEGNTYLDNTSYYAKEKAVSTLAVKVYDTENNAVEDANVQIGALEQLTNARGKASFELLQGVYTIEISTEGNRTLEKDIVLSGEDESVNIVYDPASIPTPTPTPEPGMSYKLAAAGNGGKVSVELSAYEGLGTEAEKTIYIASYKDGRLLNVAASTDTAVSGFSFNSEAPAEADKCVCMAWDRNGKPIAAAVTLRNH